MLDIHYVIFTPGDMAYWASELGNSCIRCSVGGTGVKEGIALLYRREVCEREDESLGTELLMSDKQYRFESDLSC